MSFMGRRGSLSVTGFGMNLLSKKVSGTNGFFFKSTSATAGVLYKYVFASNLVTSKTFAGLANSARDGTASVSNAETAIIAAGCWQTFNAPSAQALRYSHAAATMAASGLAYLLRLGSAFGNKTSAWFVSGVQGTAANSPGSQLVSVQDYASGAPSFGTNLTGNSASGCSLSAPLWGIVKLGAATAGSGIAQLTTNKYTYASNIVVPATSLINAQNRQVSFGIDTLGIFIATSVSTAYCNKYTYASDSVTQTIVFASSGADRGGTTCLEYGLAISGNGSSGATQKYFYANDTQAAGAALFPSGGTSYAYNNGMYNNGTAGVSA